MFSCQPPKDAQKILLVEDNRELRIFMYNSLIDTYHVRHLVFDFTETEFMDSSGIGVIIGRCKNLGYSGGDVSACHLNERVDKIFTVSGLKKIIQVKE